MHTSIHNFDNITSEDLDKATDLLDDFLSYDRRDWAFPRSTKVFGVVAKNKNNLLGVGLMSIYIKNAFLETFPELSEFIGITDSVCLFGRAAVIPSKRGHGIYTSLFNSRLEILSASSITPLVVLTHNFSKVPLSFYEKFGLKKVLEIKNYWREYLLEEKTDCPRCGEDECICTAQFLLTTLKI